MQPHGRQRQRLCLKWVTARSAQWRQSESRARLDQIRLLRERAGAAQGGVAVREAAEARDAAVPRRRTAR